MSYRSIGLTLSLSLHALIAAGIYQWQQQRDEPEVRTEASKAIKLSMAMFQEPVPPAEQQTPVENESTDSEVVALDNNSKSVAPKAVEAPQPAPKPEPEPSPPPPVATASEKKSPAPTPPETVQPKTTVTAEPAAVTTPAVQGTTTTNAENAQADAKRRGIENAYKNAVRVAILKQRKYPRQARRKRKEGTVRIAFQLTRSGAMNNLWVVQSSGVAQLDKAALDAVRKVKQFPAIPTDISREQWNFELPVSFKLAS